MKRLFLPIVMLLLTIVTSSIQANTLLYGAGTESCGSWLEERKLGHSSLVYNHYVGWVTGYVSGFMVSVGSGVYRDTDLDAMLVYIDNYCQENPIEQFGNGARLLVFDLRKPSPE